MTITYKNVFDELDKFIYDVNPAKMIGIASRLGQYPLKVDDPYACKYVEFDAIKKANKVRFADSVEYDAVSDSILEPGRVKAKELYWNVVVTKDQMDSMTKNMNGIVAQQVQSEIISQQDFFTRAADYYLLGYLYSASDNDYDQEWRPLMKLNADVTGTVSNPADCCSTPGTIDATAIKMSGAARHADAFERSIAHVKEFFFQQYDSNTAQSMFTENNTFDLFAHPAVIEKMKHSFNYNAGGYSDISRSVYDMCIEAGITPYPTLAVDAAYDGASNTVAELVMSMNTTKNFQINNILPYEVGDWEYLPEKRKYIKTGRWKFLPFITPYYVNDKWKKAMLSFSYIPYSES